MKTHSGRSWTTGIDGHAVNDWSCLMGVQEQSRNQSNIKHRRVITEKKPKMNKLIPTGKRNTGLRKGGKNPAKINTTTSGATTDFCAVPCTWHFTLWGIDVRSSVKEWIVAVDQYHQLNSLENRRCHGKSALTAFLRGFQPYEGERLAIVKSTHGSTVMLPKSNKEDAPRVLAFTVPLDRKKWMRAP